MCFSPSFSHKENVGIKEGRSTVFIRIKMMNNHTMYNVAANGLLEYINFLQCALQCIVCMSTLIIIKQTSCELYELQHIHSYIT